MKKLFRLILLPLSTFALASEQGNAQSPDAAEPTATPTAKPTKTPAPVQPASKLTSAAPKAEQTPRGAFPITRLKVCLANDATVICAGGGNTDLVLPELNPGLNNYKLKIRAVYVKGEPPIKSVRFNIARGTECAAPVEVNDTKFIDNAIANSMAGAELRPDQQHPSVLCQAQKADGLEHFCPLPFGGPLYDYLQAKPLERPFNLPASDSEALERICKGNSQQPAVGYLAIRVETATVQQNPELKKEPDIVNVRACIASFGLHVAKVCTPTIVADGKTETSPAFHFDPRVPNGVVSSIVLSGK